ncbi:WYL domain-containing protein [Leptospira interrogans]|uniref:WYL domain-containing protein n=1 Tax=Leptospira interrogans TaxID=173 RepID=UPI000344A1DD|nr:WYL domain-containing protein [Leptospira interrogans]KAA1268289.1 WYL domain-containing transcriptional regulator [Leptospira interrogans serovar Weerasinghe]KAA1290343.1 WYL domain-containing transcriptional regulator [Leptospira interrogans serovar Geyaweera]QCO34506.1 WYL domain-containing transcriptional regulator [Leptospira interrogans]QCO36178.1 WYL domain-containing transcriptional regulator [Leptospira interrogans]QCO39883.1 WYL domain-containing transcriptional regulator [Leptosp
MSEIQNWNEDEEDFPIPIKEAGKTESRLSALLFNLLTRHSPMSFTKIRSLLPDHYQNLENPDSDRKKLSRDIEELGELGFLVRSTQEGYILDRNVSNRELKLDKEEFSVLAETILRSYQETPSLELYSLSQKLFEGKLDIYPELETDLKTQKNLSQVEASASEELLKKLLEALKIKSPIQFLYYKTFPEETYKVEADPIRLIRKNSEDYYLLAYDRKKKERRRFIIPKITKVETIAENPLYQPQGQKRENSQDWVLHPILFQVHEPIEVELICDPEFSYKVRNSISEIPYEEFSRDSFRFKVTNQEGLFPLLIEARDSIQKILPESVAINFRKNVEQMAIYYRYFIES